MGSTLFARAALLLALLLHAHLLSSQATAAPLEDQTKTDKTNHWHREIVGSIACARCHNNNVEGQGVPLPGGGQIKLVDDGWVLYGEYPVWAKEDKHGQAYSVLLNERSKKMGKLLGVKHVHRDRRCLACHTGYPIDAMTLEEDGLVSKNFQNNLNVNLGVSCEGCHGPAGDILQGDQVVLSGWMGPHQIQPQQPLDQQTPAWRFLDPATKQKKYGFWDVRSPVGKAKICASCHIGNVAQGKIVTHDMFAAGHPPLSNFEVETFVNQMPRHWRPLSAKPKRVRDEFLANTTNKRFAGLAYREGDLHRTKSMLIGALVTLSEHLKVTSHLIDSKVTCLVQKPTWPELAQFDCFACHHELRTPAWRQARQPQVGAPGRPALREWTTALAEIALETVGAEPLETHLQAVREAMNAQPFGVKADVQSNTMNAAKWLASIADTLQSKSLTESDGFKVRRSIANAAARNLADYDTGRQFVWAFRIVDAELNHAGSPDEVQRILSEFDADIFLDLRGGNGATVQFQGEQTARNIKEVNLKKALPLIADYDPWKCQERFKKIAQLLQSK